MGKITIEQYETLLRPLNASRVETRRQGGKDLSYLATWDVKAHLTRVFGFCNWDSEVLEYNFIGERHYTSTSNNAEMVEVIYNARVRLTIRDADGGFLCTHTEAAAGSTSGPISMLGEHHDNALKTAESDALKRCAINLGTQFGLSLYCNGTMKDVIRGTLVVPEGYVKPEPNPDEKARMEAALAQSLGAQPVDQ
jgi:recombination DNA repair RAD52 pathway protein